MISSEFDDARREGRIVLRPNRSWSWRANGIFLAVLMAVSLTNAAWFAYRGMWVILPYTVLELAVLAGCLHYCVRRTHRQEVLTFSLDRLILERGVNRPQVRIEFQRYFTRIFVLPPRHPWYDKQIALRCRGADTEIGGFLSGDEKDALVAQLRVMIQRFDEPSPLPT